MEEFSEGDLYEGSVSLSGGDGLFRRWIVVSPFGRIHIHSIDDPLELHCWPISVLTQGLQEGKLRHIGAQPDHPLIRLQRRKEAAGIADAHLGLHGDDMERMFELLEMAAAEGIPYAPYAAGEIIAFTARAPFSDEALSEIRARVHEVLDTNGLSTPPPPSSAPGPEPTSPETSS